jgi:hypothetical protein
MLIVEIQKPEVGQKLSLNGKIKIYLIFSEAFFYYQITNLIEKS